MSFIKRCCLHLQKLGETGSLKVYKYRIVLYCGRVPATNAPGCTAPDGLLYKPWFLAVRSYLHRQVSPPETLVVKGGTIWPRNGR